LNFYIACGDYLKARQSGNPESYFDNIIRLLSEEGA